MRAVLFDVDGVLLDTGPLFATVWSEWATGHGLEPTTVLTQMYGRRSADTVRAVAPHLDPVRELAVLDRMVLPRIDTVQAVPGASELLGWLTRRQVPWAVVTSGTRWFVQRCLVACGLPVPDVGVYDADVAAGKPAPDCYLAAAARLVVPAADCLVVEDAPHGVAAAKAAGCTVIGVMTTHRAEELSRADQIVTNLSAAHAILLSRMVATAPPQMSGIRRRPGVTMKGVHS